MRHTGSKHEFYCQLDAKPNYDKTLSKKGGAFQKTLVGQNGLFTGCSAMLR